MKLQNTIMAIEPLDQAAMEGCRERWDSLCKPLYAFGRFETMTARMAGVLRDPEVHIEKKALCIMCSDHGVLEEGVSQSDAEITAIMTEGFTKLACSASIMCDVAGVDLYPVDVGVYRDVCPEVINKKIAYGTRNMAKEPAMTREQAIRSIEVGIEMAEELAGKGYQLICTGEMGVGNTTPTAAMASVFLGVPVEKVTGRGSGLKADGVRHKVKVLKRILSRYTFDLEDPIDILAKVGGFEIGAMAGLYIGGAANHMAVFADGVISCVAAMLASKIAPACKDYIFASHVSLEPASRMLLDAMEMEPCLDAGMHLGEGTGAVALMPVLDLALSVFHRMATFNENSIEDYEAYDSNDMKEE